MKNLMIRNSEEVLCFAERVTMKNGKGKKPAVKFYIETSSRKRVDLPGDLEKFIIKTISLMTKGKSITVLASDTKMSVKEAADYLDFPVPYLNKLLEEGKIPYKGRKQKKTLTLSDVLVYRRKFKKRQERALSFISREALAMKWGYE